MGLNVIWEEERKPAEESLLHSATILSMVVHERDDVSSASLSSLHTLVFLDPKMRLNRSPKT